MTNLEEQDLKAILALELSDGSKFVVMLVPMECNGGVTSYLHMQCYELLNPPYLTGMEDSLLWSIPYGYLVDPVAELVSDDDIRDDYLLSINGNSSGQ